MMKEMMEDMFKAEFGMDVDFSDMDISDEAIARKMAELKGQFEYQQEERNRKQETRKNKKGN
ncbi:hypothetical protein [Flavobacterium sp.]|uniref:hypothetical protein n=1 Tax=Flavobacterium sp. TaxID=239 RepID=UPI002B4AD2B2|nr:hypothetical protein [Flavobacterium sp.]HLF52108.1 hypothetical protein [Flavobacterium sp.]